MAIEVSHPATGQRLRDLGFQPGQPVTCVQRSPMGGPRAFKISSGVYALDQELAEAIRIELEKG